MNREQLLLVKLAEEAAEIAQIALKAAQFGLDEVYEGTPGQSNANRIHGEIEDMLAVVEMLNDECNFRHFPNRVYRTAKKAKVNKWALYAVSLGQVRAD